MLAFLPWRLVHWFLIQERPLLLTYLYHHIATVPTLSPQT